MMAIVKFAKIALVGIAAFHFFRQEEDVRFWLKTCAIVLIAQALVCLYIKGFQQVYQVRGWFEHQNSMVMYTYMLGLPLLAAAMTSGGKKSDLNLYAAGYIAAGICTVAALSRAGMAAFAMGTGIVVVLSLWDKITYRRLVVIALMGVIAIAGLIMVADTVFKRFQDSLNYQSSKTRELLNESSRAMVKDHPWAGVGWNTYGVMINPPHPYGDNFDEFARSVGMSRGYIDSLYGKPISESWYYLIMAETGLPSIVALFAFMFVTLFWCARLAFYHRRAFLGAVAIGLFTALGMTYLQCNLERVLTQPKNMVPWFVCLALIARMEWWRRQERSGAVPAWKAEVAHAPVPEPAQTPAPASVLQPMFAEEAVAIEPHLRPSNHPRVTLPPPQGIRPA
jgi:hypothetical protein